MNLANIITMTRILLMPIYLMIFYSTMENKFIFAGIILILSGITDVLDGYVARKYNMVTKLGTALDPVADKLTTFTVLFSFTFAGLIPYWILLILGIKELLLLIGGGVLYYIKDRKVIPADKFGKVATFLFYLSIISVVFGFSKMIVNILFSITVFLHLLAFFNYFIIFSNTINKKDKI